MEKKAENDSEKIMKFIKSHSSFNDIYNIFMKGPKPGKGFYVDSR